MKKIMICLLIFLASQLVFADVVPQGAAKDSRVQTVVYEPDNVINIYTMIGRTTLIQLEDDERIEGEASGLGIGDSAAWAIGVRGNNILLKPAAEMPTTNMTVITNKRTYLFSLLPARNNLPVTFILRFEYPDTRARLEEEMRQRQQRAEEAAQAALAAFLPDTKSNINYWMWGNKELAPLYAWDDGRFTYFRFPDARSLPSITKLLPSGQEAIINMHIQGDTIIVHETAKIFYLRLGNAVLGIENKGHNPYGHFNHTGTTVDGLIRVERE